MDELAYWVGFNKVVGIGPARLRALLDALGDVRTAWQAGSRQLEAAGLDRRSLANLQVARESLNLQAELERLHRFNVSVLTWESRDYPINLRNIVDAPPVIYVKGELLPEDDWAVAIVGTRRASAYGKEAARRLAADLAHRGLTVVSGLASGIDAAAHQAALDAGGRTLAVLGSGVDVIYPAENRRLAQAITQQGALISEYALGTPPERSNFPPRNRVISGLSLGIVVVEAGQRSGALITADFALEQGRDVLAVPGSIFQKSCEGSNRLIQNGAKPVLSAVDVLEELELAQVEQQAQMRATVPITPTEETLLTLLMAGPCHVDELGRTAGLPAAEVASTLALLELKGLARHLGSMTYVSTR